MDVSPSAQVQLLDQIFSLTEDIAEELEDFILLTRLGFHAEAEMIFCEFLEPYQEYFPVMVENATRLICISVPLDPHFDRAVSRYSASQPEYWLLRLMECLSDLYCDIRLALRYGSFPRRTMHTSDSVRGAKHMVSEKKYLSAATYSQPMNGDEGLRTGSPLILPIYRTATGPTLSNAAALAQEWHDLYQTLKPESPSEVEWHTTEVYLEIIVLATQRGMEFDRKYYQPPDGDDLVSPQWTGFISKCVSLNSQQRYWEAQQIVSILLPVLPSTEADSVFQRYLSSLEGTPLMTSTAVARLAASKSFLLRVLVDPENWIVEGTLLQTVQEAICIRPVVEYLFTRPEEVETGIYDEWRQHLWTLIVHKEVKHNQAALSILLNAASAQGIRPFLWAAEKGKDTMKAMADIFSSLLGLQEEEVRTGFVQSFIKWSVSRRKSLFWCALESDSIKAAEFAMEVAKSDPNERGDDNITPLIWAVRSGKIEWLQFLLAWDQVEPDLQDSTRRSALSWAAEAGSEQMVQLLARSEKLNPDLQDSKGRTPLSWAAGSGHVQIVDLLVHNPRVNPNSVDSSGWTPLSWAAANGHPHVVMKMLKIPHLEVDTPDTDTRTALSWAAAEGHIEVVRLLLRDPRVDVNSQDNRGATPLFRAIIKGQLTVVQCLLENNADPIAEDSRGWTPLVLAVVNNRLSIAEMLLQINRVDVNASDASGRTAISHAAERASVDIMRLLLSRADPDIEDHKGWTPLMQAANRGSVDLVGELLATGKVDPTWSSLDGWTARTRALLHGHDAVVRLLDEHLATTLLTKG